MVISARTNRTAQISAGSAEFLMVISDTRKSSHEIRMVGVIAMLMTKSSADESACCAREVNSFH